MLNAQSTDANDIRRRPNKAISPDICVMCYHHNETHENLFLHCPIAWKLRSYLFDIRGEDCVGTRPQLRLYSWSYNWVLGAVRMHRFCAIVLLCGAFGPRRILASFGIKQCHVLCWKTEAFFMLHFWRRHLKLLEESPQLILWEIGRQFCISLSLFCISLFSLFCVGGWLVGCFCIFSSSSNKFFFYLKRIPHKQLNSPNTW